MSMVYWGITGYGIENIEKLIDENKIQEIVGENDLHEYAFNHFDHDNFAFSCNGDESFYFLYTPQMPWRQTELEKTFTCYEDISRQMYKVLKPVLFDYVTEEEIIQKSEFISTYGAS